MKQNYQKTIIACFIGYIVQAIVNNFVPLLFVTFQNSYSISLSKITALITVNFVIQLVVDMLSAWFIDKIGYRASAIIAHIFSAAGLISLTFLPEVLPDPFMGILMDNKTIIRDTYEKNHGIFRLIPNFVPRRFSQPGKRLRLHPDDYYALGTERGAIKERWFSSVIQCMNGDKTQADEGLSYVSYSNDPKDRFTLKEAVEELGAELIGPRLMEDYGTWPMYSKFFDYDGPLFHHLHLDFEAAAAVGRLGKPEAYYYPPQYNNVQGHFPHTYFGFHSGVTPEQVKERLAHFETEDTRITELSKAYRIQLGTGWYTPPGVLHAPGSYLTYEPQWNSDVNSVYENIVDGEVYPYSMLVENCPEDRQRDLDYVIGLLDWEKNMDLKYKEHYFREPITITDNDDYCEKWIVYGNDYIFAKELTIYPGKSALIQDCTAYGCILVQGHGRLGDYDAEAAGMLRFGQLSADEYFVGEPAAKQGVWIENHSQFEPLVMLKHFAPSNTEAPRTAKAETACE